MFPGPGVSSPTQTSAFSGLTPWTQKRRRKWEKSSKGDKERGVDVSLWGYNCSFRTAAVFRSRQEISQNIPQSATPPKRSPLLLSSSHLPFSPSIAALGTSSQGCLSPPAPYWPIVRHLPCAADLLRVEHAAVELVSPNEFPTLTVWPKATLWHLLSHKSQLQVGSLQAL